MLLERRRWGVSGGLERREGGREGGGVKRGSEGRE